MKSDGGLLGVRIRPPGPTLAELRASLEASKADPSPEAEPSPAPAPTVPERIESIASRLGWTRVVEGERAYWTRPSVYAPGTADDFPASIRPVPMRRRKPSTGRTGLADADVADAPGNLIGHPAD